ncbi:hypothetical protein GTY87_20375 [Streptomyces sp. SID7813]|uniref:Uncharacterized protein n=1 Tax=Streptomyces coelicolor (strain ATCC BAA-471 / A3(2) / M145) TaxID=100226 RepID=Q93J17_STRCO|nr:hypothetical protein [Streptomyces sp. SID7813]QFI43982.1 hypothetical protein FQ762_20555 [Streptomyces coelicolor A3(2)]CAC44714.1 hypothetical protein [Streptomyces coelicolor A3(2)]
MDPATTAVEKFPKLDRCRVRSCRHFHGCEPLPVTHEVEIMHAWATSVVVMANLNAWQGCLHAGLHPLFFATGPLHRGTMPNGARFPGGF